MKTTLDYLQDVTNRHAEKIRNDNQLAKFLGVTRQAISQYRKGQSMSVAIALKVARVLEIHPGETVFSTMHQQATTEEEREFWLACYDTLPTK